MFKKWFTTTLRAVLYTHGKVLFPVFLCVRGLCHPLYWANHISLSNWLLLTRVNCSVIGLFPFRQQFLWENFHFASLWRWPFFLELAFGLKECSWVTFWTYKTGSGWGGPDRSGTGHSLIWEAFSTCSCRSCDNPDWRVILAKPCSSVLTVVLAVVQTVGSAHAGCFLMLMQSWFILRGRSFLLQSIPSSMIFLFQANQSFCAVCLIEFTSKEYMQYKESVLDHQQFTETFVAFKPLSCMIHCHHTATKLVCAAAYQRWHFGKCVATC